MTDTFDPDRVAVLQVTWNTHQATLKELRRRVFIEEQGVSAQDEWDDRDAEAQHFLALNATGAPLGTARLLPSGKVTRMAVVPEWRNRGVGSQILERVVETAREQSLSELYLDAQTAARRFYERQGFCAEGEIFLDAGLPHIRMRRALVEPMLSGEVVQVTQRSQALGSLRLFTREARHSIDLLSDALSPQVYGDAELVDHISHLARRSTRSRVRILVRDSRPLRGVDHALVALARRLPSRVSLRRVVENTPLPTFSFYCVDRAHLVYFSSEADLKGFARYAARAESLRRLGEFENWWQYASEPDPDLGSLLI